jgi:hypothetical protein
VNPFGFTGQRVSSVEYVDRVFDAFVDLNWCEIDRRSRFGTPIVVDRCVLECLSGLPLDHAVGLDALGLDVIATLRSLPPGVVNFVSGAVVRQWSPAVSLKGVVAEARSLKAGITQVGMLSAFAPRGVVVQSAGRPRSPSLLYAEELGIGVAYQSPNDEEAAILHAPAKRAVSVGTVHWRLLEAIFEQAVHSGIVFRSSTSV